MRHSCGAILYSFNDKGEFGIILGMEGWEWLPFKGCNEPPETYEQTAIREVYEETCGLVKIDNISLDHEFKSKHKYYHIGLVYTDYSIINKFPLVRQKENRDNFVEKKSIKFFTLDQLKTHMGIHDLTQASINFYWDKMINLAKGKSIKEGTKTRNRAVDIQFIHKYFNSKYSDVKNRRKKIELFPHDKVRNINQSWRSKHTV